MPCCRHCHVQQGGVGGRSRLSIGKMVNPKICAASDPTSSARQWVAPKQKVHQPQCAHHKYRLNCVG